MGTLLAGSLDKRVTFMRRRAGVDELNEQDPNFDPLFSTWANVRPVSAREIFTGVEHMNVSDAVVSIRYHPANPQLAAFDRVVVDGPYGGMYDLQGPPSPDDDALVMPARRIDHPQDLATPYGSGS